ncbi:ATP-binding cassette domain-containing protein [Limnoraphis robusta]|uniref:ATP-binding cassette domain-containing protein n=1 Tax=Limnoraphis robusta TaxID=1118279 RepID=UPI00315A3EFC
MRKWSQVLSIGEQQRLAFARLLLHQPEYAILDEATSALDIDNEELLYQHLQKTGIHLISVGHRSTLFKYHQRVLELSVDLNWRLLASHEYQFYDQKN